MAYTSYKGGYFPSQVVSDFEKITEEYGLKVAQAIENGSLKSHPGISLPYICIYCTACTT